MKQKKKNNKMRTFSAEYVDLLYRDNYRHVLVLDSGELMEIRQCARDILQSEYMYTLSFKCTFKLSVNTSISFAIF